ncbi:CopG family transcriptional regulator [Desulfurococcaceae archaeon MEX13E-LK6-19]|nr:CopG family transcriptional regulator [Desulfurococcaceae archaeon MEX13E-LK6-19]
MSREKKERVLIIKIPEELYIALRERSKAEGYTLLADYIKAILMKELGFEVTPSRIEEIEKRISEIEELTKNIDLTKIERKVMRKITDMINPFTAKIDDLARKYSELVERVERIEQVIKNIEEKLEKPPVQPQPAVRHEARRKTGLERLKEQGVLFESELQRLRDRDSFFLYLRRGGAKVIEAVGERIAIDKDFWEKFKRKLFEEITTNNDEQIKMYLSKIEYRLFEKLRESGLIYFDSTERKWKPTSRELIEE